MYRTGKGAELAREFRNYGMDILGIQETRWLGMGRVTLNSGETILYAGHEDEEADHTQGVGFMLSRKAAKALTAWEPNGPRLISATFRTNRKGVNMRVINCYAPTEDKDIETKENFYSRLQAILDKGRSKDITLLLGDFNAQVGGDNTGYEGTMGTHGLDRMTENGEFLADTCANNHLTIGGSLFPHKDIHKGTWTSPNHALTANQIDHICISRQFRTSLQDVKVYRGADVGSDHHLVMAKIKLKLRKGKFKANERPRFNVNALRNPQRRQAFAVTVRNRFQALEALTDSSSVEEQWKGIKDTWKIGCEEILGKAERHNKEWITEETLKRIEERKVAKAALNTSKTRAAKAAAQEKFSQADRTVKRSARQD